MNRKVISSFAMSCEGTWAAKMDMLWSVRYVRLWWDRGAIEVDVLGPFPASPKAEGMLMVDKMSRARQ